MTSCGLITSWKPGKNVRKWDGEEERSKAGKLVPFRPSLLSRYVALFFLALPTLRMSAVPRHNYLTLLFQPENSVVKIQLFKQNQIDVSFPFSYLVC